MTIAHENIVDPNIHEPKGVSSASISTVYKANGAGSGSWVKVTSDMIDVSSIKDVNLVTFNAVIPDVSTASSTYVVVPFAGTVVACYSALQAAITTADATVVLKIGSTQMTGGSLTIAEASSAAGDVDSCLITANNSLTQGQAFSIETDGGSTGTAALVLTIVFTLS